MRKYVAKKTGWLWAVAGSVAVAGWLCISTSESNQAAAQNTTPATKTAAKETATKEAATKETGAKEAAPAKKAAKKPAGRLPAFYGDLVTPEQKTKIYDIQDDYTAQLDELVEQVKAIKEKRDAEIEAVLTAEQKEKLKALKEAAAAKKKATTASKPAETKAAVASEK